MVTLCLLLPPSYHCIVIGYPRRCCVSFVPWCRSRFAFLFCCASPRSLSLPVCRVAMSLAHFGPGGGGVASSASSSSPAESAPLLPSGAAASHGAHAAPSSTTFESFSTTFKCIVGSGSGNTRQQGGTRDTGTGRGRGHSDTQSDVALRRTTALGERGSEAGCDGGDQQDRSAQILCRGVHRRSSLCSVAVCARASLVFCLFPSPSVRVAGWWARCAWWASVCSLCPPCAP